MKKLYVIIAGMGGGINSTSPKEVEEFETPEDAVDYARQLAVEEYESYEGLHGILNEEECEEEGVEYGDEIDSWIDYEAIEITKENYKEYDDYFNADTICKIYKYVETLGG